MCRCVRYALGTAGAGDGKAGYGKAGVTGGLNAVQPIISICYHKILFTCSSSARTPQYMWWSSR